MNNNLEKVEFGKSKTAEAVKGDFDFFAYKLVKIMSALGVKLFVAESCTGGLFCKRLTDISGTSKMLLGGVVCYTNEIKTSVLGVGADTIAEYTEVSAECALEMARGAREISGADISLSVTGFASDGEGVPSGKVGLVYIALSCDEKEESLELHLSGSREEVRYKATDEMLKMILAHYRSEKQ